MLSSIITSFELIILLLNRLKHLYAFSLRIISYQHASLWCRLKFLSLRFAAKIQNFKDDQGRVSPLYTTPLVSFRHLFAHVLLSCLCLCRLHGIDDWPIVESWIWLNILRLILRFSYSIYWEWIIINRVCLIHQFSTFQCCTLCYSIIMLHVTLILLYHASMLTPQNSIMSCALWLSHAWYYGVQNILMPI